MQVTNYTDKTTDTLTIGDQFCSFIGYLRRFGIYGGATGMFDGKAQ